MTDGQLICGTILCAFIALIGCLGVVLHYNELAHGMQGYCGYAVINVCITIVTFFLVRMTKAKHKDN